MFRLICAFCLLLAAPLNANSVARSAGLDNPTLLGSATVGFLGFTAYDASLYTANGTPFSWETPMALELTYNRDFTKDALTNGTKTELERLWSGADTTTLLRKLSGCFEAVGPGDRFTAVSNTSDSVSLWLNGAQTCSVQHPNVREQFLSIWLSDQSRLPRVSRKLRGG